jgi:uroporphyrinogen-III synthase
MSLEAKPKHSIKSLLISQANPAGNKSPYISLAEKYNLNVVFCPFVEIAGLGVSDFRKQKINLSNFTAVIFTSRNAIDHFFRIVAETKTNISQDLKYFCATEAVALYLQKFIQYRKRKVFYGADGSIKNLLSVIERHVANESFLYPCSEAQDSEIIKWLQRKESAFATPVIYKVISSVIKPLAQQKFDVICLFTPGSVKSLLEQSANINGNGTLIACFGDTTIKAAQQLGLKVDISAPIDNCKTMVSALEHYLKKEDC